MKLLHLSPSIIAGLLLCVPSIPSDGAVYSYSLITANAGWLDQYSLDTSNNFVGNEACVPTSSTNAMTYLQNTAPEYFGTALTGTTYEDWKATDQTLIGPDYMDTTPDPDGGTYYNHIPYALNKYIREDKGFTQVNFGGIYPVDTWGDSPYDKPSYMLDGVPSGLYFAEWLYQGLATIFSIEYSNGGGHELFLTGIDWDDANNDGIVQESENALLHFIDPLDPAFYGDDNLPSSGPKVTTGSIYHDDKSGGLLLSYEQYHGDLPYTSDYELVTGSHIVGAFTMSVPEPSEYAAAIGILALVGAAFWRRRRD
ncbi:hypothetical protein [Cerasicoccus frondis]|uniref:hypothetical protein n=1 Tax=Cerasicoccus frondis TaxID=490090 RepID=UPI00285255D8|nr:hypothetical protein [Cerasicoccus frondis]